MSQQIIRIINTNENSLGFAVKRFSDGYFLTNLAGIFGDTDMLGSPFDLTQLSGYKSSVFRYALDTSTYEIGSYIIYIINKTSLSIEYMEGFSI